MQLAVLGIDHGSDLFLESVGASHMDRFMLYSIGRFKDSEQQLSLSLQSGLSLL